MHDDGARLKEIGWTAGTGTEGLEVIEWRAIGPVGKVGIAAEVDIMEIDRNTTDHSCLNNGSR